MTYGSKSTGYVARERGGAFMTGASMTPAYARMFVDARRILGVPEAELALRLGTSPETIRALEAGNLAALPPWPETAHVVTAYLGGLGIDPQPVLRALSRDLAAMPPLPASPAHRTPAQGRPDWPAPVSTQRPVRSPVQPVPKTRPPRRSRSAVAPPPGLGGRLRTSVVSSVAAGRSAMATARFAMPLPRLGDRLASAARSRAVRTATALGVAAVLLAAVAQTSLAHAVLAGAAAPLPASWSRAMDRLVEQVRVQLAPVREGLRWIEVDDPRSRRGDKLQNARR